MATERQIIANRANAKRSTGPKTKRGRQASSRNASRHGLSSSKVDRSLSTESAIVAETLVDGGASEPQVIAARQVAEAHINVLRVRAVRAALLASLDQHACGLGHLRHLLALDRYERIARGRRRLAVDRFLSE